MSGYVAVMARPWLISPPADDSRPVVTSHSQTQFVLSSAITQKCGGQFDLEDDEDERSTAEHTFPATDFDSGLPDYDLSLDFRVLNVFMWLNLAFLHLGKWILFSLFPSTRAKDAEDGGSYEERTPFLDLESQRMDFKAKLAEHTARLTEKDKRIDQLNDDVMTLRTKYIKLLASTTRLTQSDPIITDKPLEPIAEQDELTNGDGDGQTEHSSLDGGASPTEGVGQTQSAPFESPLSRKSRTLPLKRSVVVACSVPLSRLFGFDESSPSSDSD